MTIDEIKSFITSISLSKVIQEKLSESEKKTLEQCYHSIGKRFKKSNCNDCYERAFLELEKLVKSNNISIMNDCQFKLRDGIKIQNHKLNIIYNNNNLDDEGALMILSVSPKSISQFVKYPDNWEKLVDEYKKTGPIFKAKNKKKSSENIEQNETDVNEIKKEYLKGINLSGLKDIAKENKYPENEWEFLKKSELINYLLAKSQS